MKRCNKEQQFGERKKRKHYRNSVYLMVLHVSFMCYMKKDRFCKTGIIFWSKNVNKEQRLRKI